MAAYHLDKCLCGGATGALDKTASRDGRSIRVSHATPREHRAARFTQRQRSGPRQQTVRVGDADSAGGSSARCCCDPTTDDREH